MAPLTFRDGALLHASGIVKLMCEMRPSSSFSPTNGKKTHEIMRLARIFREALAEDMGANEKPDEPGFRGVASAPSATNFIYLPVRLS
jgi:hypothetical protein